MDWVSVSARVRADERGLAALVDSEAPILVLAGSVVLLAGGPWALWLGADSASIVGRDLGDALVAGSVRGSAGCPIAVRAAPLVAAGRELTVVWPMDRDFGGLHPVGEAQVREVARRAMVQEVLDGSSDWVFAKDLEFRFLLVNRAFAASQGLEPEDMHGRHDTDFWPLELCEGDPARGTRGFHDDDRLAFEGHVVRNPDDLATRGDGELRIFDTMKSPLRDAEGRIVGVLSYSRDVTDQRRAEAAVRSNEARYRRLFEQGALGMAEIDTLTGRIVAVNEKLCQITGYSADELAARGGFAITHPEDLARDRPQLDQLRVGAVEEVSSEARFVRADGQIGWAALNIRPLVDSLEKHHMVVVEDITARKRAEDELRLRDEQLRQAQKLEAIGQLAGGVAHDFNNLLTVVLSLASELEQRLTADPEGASIAHDITEAGRRASALTRQLLVFARKKFGVPQEVSLATEVVRFERLLRRMLGERVELHLELDAATPHVLVDPGHLEQVLVNLVVNANDAMPTGGALWVRTHARSEGTGRPPSAILEVEDTGVGMSPELHAHLFEPFFTTKELGRGTGLGLATVYGIVTQSGGDIEVWTEQGRGSRFRIAWPGRPPRPVSVPERKPRQPGRGETILVVEDEAEVRAVVVRVLVSAGYHVLSADQADRGFELARSRMSRGEPLDLLLTDIVMPGPRGPELAARLDVAGATFPVLYMSGYAPERQAEVDPSLILPKPFGPDELLSRVRSALERAKREGL